MFCTKCGMKNADDAMFCSGCGANLNGGQKVKKQNSGKATLENNNRKIGVILIVAVTVIAIIATSFTLCGRGYEATIKKFVDAEFDADAETIIKLIPKEMVKYALEESGYDADERDELVKELKEELQDQLDYLNKYLGEDWKITYDILNVEDVTGSDLKTLKEGYKDYDIKVSEAKTVEVQITVKSDETESSNSLDISLIKVGRSWYLDLESMGNIF